jgi:hypothetical protein
MFEKLLKSILKPFKIVLVCSMRSFDCAKIMSSFCATTLMR